MVLVGADYKILTTDGFAKEGIAFDGSGDPKVQITAREPKGAIDLGYDIVFEDKSVLTVGWDQDLFLQYNRKKEIGGLKPSVIKSDILYETQDDPDVDYFVGPCPPLTMPLADWGFEDRAFGDALWMKPEELSFFYDLHTFERHDVDLACPTLPESVLLGSWDQRYEIGQSIIEGLAGEPATNKQFGTIRYHIILEDERQERVVKQLYMSLGCKVTQTSLGVVSVLSRFPFEGEPRTLHRETKNSGRSAMSRKVAGVILRDPLELVELNAVGGKTIVFGSSLHILKV